MSDAGSWETMSLPVNSMQGLGSREPNHWRNRTLELVPGERGSLWIPRQRVLTDRREPATRIRTRKGFTRAIGKGMGCVQAHAKISDVKQYFRIGKDFSPPVLPTIWKTRWAPFTTRQVTLTLCLSKGTDRTHCWIVATLSCPY
ncbi:hypothetical protein V8C35DRAFT_293322 [Trichoderma chlorosporum]